MRSNLGSLVDFSGVSCMFPVDSKAFTQVCVNLDINISTSQLGIEQVLHVTAGVKILKTSMLPTPRAVSHGGQALTGLMLIAEGHVEIKVEYMADDAAESISTTNFTETFSTYLILDERFTYDSEAIVSPYIEDIYIRQINKRRLCGCVMFLLDAVPSNAM